MAASSEDTLFTGAKKEASDSQFSQEALAISDSQNTPERVLDDTLDRRPRWYWRKSLLVVVGLLIFLVLVLAIFLPVFFVVVRKKHRETATSVPQGTSIPNPGSPTGEVVCICLTSPLSHAEAFEDWGRWVGDQACQRKHFRIQQSFWWIL